MPTKPSLKSRRSLAFLLVAAAGVGLAAAFHASRDDAAANTTVAEVLVHEADGLRYEYHVPTGRESLYDARQDPRGLVNVLRAHPDKAANCRRAIEKKLGVPSLDALRARYEENARRLHALGYL